MNVFYLDPDPAICARYHNDRHVVKMIVEYAQILSTAQRVLDGVCTIEKREKNGKVRRIKRWNTGDSRDNVLYLATHVQHPSAIWARWSKETYMHLVAMLECLLNEYTLRYGRVHKTQSLLPILKVPPKKHHEVGFVEPFLAMPLKYQKPSALESYRAYYANEKTNGATWKIHGEPDWIAVYKSSNV
jgi:hypothetical protein